MIKKLSVKLICIFFVTSWYFIGEHIVSNIWMAAFFIIVALEQETRK